jgi:hypothetical protein
MGEAKRRKLAGDYPKPEERGTGYRHLKTDYDGPPELATTIWADFDDGTVTAIIDPNDVGDMLKRVDRMASDNNLSRSSAMDWIVRAFKENKHCTQDQGPIFVATLLWLACRSEMGRDAEATAKKGGFSIGYEITHVAGKQYNFRLAVLKGHLPKDRNLADKPVAGNA